MHILGERKRSEECLANRETLNFQEEKAMLVAQKVLNVHNEFPLHPSVHSSLLCSQGGMIVMFAYFHLNRK